MKLKPFESKLPNVGTTIFTQMSALAFEHNAINLSQGFPNFKSDPHLIDLLDKYVKLENNQYAPMIGVKALRDAISDKTNKLYKAFYDPNDEITVVSGATEALFVAISTLIKPGDEVIIFEPAYDSYVPAIELNGGIPKFISLKYPEYQIDWNVVESAISSKTKLIIVNTPHNPTGRVWNENDLKSLSNLIENRNIYLLGDEVYEHILFDNKKHVSLCSNDFLKSRSFVCGSFGKTFHITGWKIGYCLAPKYLMNEFRKIHQYVTFSTFTAAQLAIAEYLQNENTYLDLPKFYQAKRDLFLKSIAKSRFTFIPSEGSFFQNLSYKNISEANDLELAIELTKTIGVASIPISVFYHNKLDQKVLRFCFAKEDQTLIQAGQVLSKL